MDPVKVKGISEWPQPTSVKEVHSFLGFCNFYCSFIPSFSEIAWPLNDLTKKTQQWQWTPIENNAFLRLKAICIASPVLHSPDWSKQFILETDVSSYALGAVIANASKMVSILSDSTVEVSSPLNKIMMPMTKSSQPFYLASKWDDPSFSVLQTQ